VRLQGEIKLQKRAEDTETNNSLWRRIGAVGIWGRIKADCTDALKYYVSYADTLVLGVELLVLELFWLVELPNRFNTIS
jgi:hypothetical protein